MDAVFLMSIFRLYPGFKTSFVQNSFRKNSFQNACFCWDSKNSLREVDQKLTFGATIGYGYSYLDFLFLHFKLFGLHAKLYDAAGATRPHSGKGPCYCYMIGRRPNSCFFSNVTVLLFCFYVKLFAPSNLSTFEAVCLALY